MTWVASTAIALLVKSPGNTSVKERPIHYYGFTLESAP